MSRHSKISLPAALAALLSIAAPVGAQDTQAAQTEKSSQVKVRELGPVEARTERPLGNPTMLRSLPDGSFFVNDQQHRQLLHFDASLKQIQVIADSANAPLVYGQRGPGLLTYAGDSVVVVDPPTMSLVVVNAQGKVARIMAPPRPNDIGLLTSQNNVSANAFDAKGNLYYKLNANAGGAGGNFQGGQGGRQGGGAGGFGGGPGGFGGGGGAGGRGGENGQQGGRGGLAGRGATPPIQPDSLPIVRANFDTRKTDTVTFVRVPKTEFSVTPTDDGGTQIRAKINPLPQGDDWSLLSDGTVAVVRVLDYHVDYYAPDGTHTSSPKLPFDWKQITDEEKVRLIDSLKIVAKDATERATAMASQGGGRGNFRQSFEPVEPERLPDYFPPVRSGSSMADRDGNLWILPSTSNIAAQIAQSMQGGGGPGGFGGRVGFGGPPGGGGGGGRGNPGRGRDSAQRGGGTNADSAQQRQRRMADSVMMANMPQLGQTQLVYDIVNRQGELVERIKLPAGRQLLGFGPNGIVYLGVREGRNGMYIEKARRTGL